MKWVWNCCKRKKRRKSETREWGVITVKEENIRAGNVGISKRGYISGFIPSSSQTTTREWNGFEIFINYVLLLCCLFCGELDTVFMLEIEVARLEPKREPQHRRGRWVDGGRQDKNTNSNVIVY